MVKYNLKKTILNYSNNKEESIIINKKYIYNLNLYKVGKINNLDIDSYFIIKWKTNNENIKNNKNIFYFDQDKNQYYELSTYINFINNNNNNINDPNLINNNKNLKKFNDLKNYNNDIFEINNSEFLSNNTKENNSTHIFKKIDNYYCNLDYIELFIEKKKINYNILNKQEIILNNNYRENYFNYIDYLNYNYVDKNNFLKYKNHYFPNFNLLNDKFLSLKLNININFNTQKKSILTICEWGYPAFGGGENWLLNMNKIFYNLNYEPYMICFSDGFKGESFQDFNYIKLDYLHIIQMPFDYLNIFKLIQIIQPNIINHQGIKRIEIMKIANILEIPFITGFCFWNNILKENFSNIKILENKQLEKDLEFLNIDGGFINYPDFFYEATLPKWLLSLSLFTLIGVPFLVLLVLGLRMLSSNIKQFSKITSITLLVIWFMALLTLIFTGAEFGASHANFGKSISNNQLDIAKKDTLVFSSMLRCFLNAPNVAL